MVTVGQPPQRRRLARDVPTCIVATPRLPESRAHTIGQTRLINALCRFAEMAEG
jgi:hypothetical protein